jgi:hypothetical protein
MKHDEIDDHVAGMRERIHSKKRTLVDLELDEKVIFSKYLRNRLLNSRLHKSSSRYGLLALSCEHNTI